MTQDTARVPTVAIAGLATESSTFTPGRTRYDDFVVTRGDEAFGRYPFLARGSTLREAATWRPALVGRALPGPVVTAEAYSRLLTELLERLAEGPAPDGVFLDLHGAMSVEGLDDPEADLVERVRSVVGPRALLSAALDLHGNVSERLVAACDLLTGYRTAPHVDVDETRERAVRNLLTRLAHGGRPVTAWVPVPVLLPGEQTSTRVEPAASIYAEVPRTEGVPGVLDASIWIGYAWADSARSRASVVVTGDDGAVVAREAERLAGVLWKRRDAFTFVAPTGTLEECLATALASSDRPFFVSDTGDNPTAGGAGDATWTLARLLEHPGFTGPDGPSVVYASLPGPAAVEAAVAAGVGGTVTVTVGAAVDDVHEGPVSFAAEVRAVHHGDPVAGPTVVLRRGGVDVIVTTRRKPFHLRADFLELGIEPLDADVVVVKIGYLEPELHAMAAGWTMALTPGGVDQDIGRLPYERIQRPMFPFDPDVRPDLTARVVTPR